MRKRTKFFDSRERLTFNGVYRYFEEKLKKKRRRIFLMECHNIKLLESAQTLHLHAECILQTVMNHKIAFKLVVRGATER